jgi:hypothetical protein
MCESVLYVGISSYWIHMYLVTRDSGEMQN